mmetsp:Transcript_56055/g.92742  ORF Transcript_56055/g.92742 Transcript_56055/m.92742 type:complete len:219 (+) Transcript_56055:653-1309(+)
MRRRRRETCKRRIASALASVSWPWMQRKVRPTTSRPLSEKPTTRNQLGLAQSTGYGASVDVTTVMSVSPQTLSGPAGTVARRKNCRLIWAFDALSRATEARKSATMLSITESLRTTPDTSCSEKQAGSTEGMAGTRMTQAAAGGRGVADAPFVGCFARWLNSAPTLESLPLFPELLEARQPGQLQPVRDWLSSSSCHKSTSIPTGEPVSSSDGGLFIR